MDTGIIVVDKSATLVYDPASHTSQKGIYYLVAPDGSTWYKNPNYDEGTYGSPDFIYEDGAFTRGLPLDEYGQIKETTADTNYIINVKLEGGGTEQYLFKYTKTTPTLEISAPTQDCSNSITTFTYTVNNQPVGYTFLSQSWLITNPLGVQTSQSGSTLTLTPLVSGTYQIVLTVNYAYTDSSGSTDVSVVDRVQIPFNYINTCGNSLILLSDLNECLKLAISGNNQYNATWLSAAMISIWADTQCGNQTASQNTYDTVMKRLQLPDSGCEGCGC